MKKISIIGMGYVGLPLAVAFQRHFNVTGFDLNQSRINELSNGLDTNNQITKKRLYNCLRLSFTSNIKTKNLT